MKKGGPLGEKESVVDRVYDLEERTSIFGEDIIRFCKRLDQDPVDIILIRQLVRAATSIGANYAEADDAESKKDFRHKIGLCRKEARETKFWLRMLRTALPAKKDRLNELGQEAKELHLIFSAIRRRTPDTNTPRN